MPDEQIKLWRVRAEHNGALVWAGDCLAATDDEAIEQCRKLIAHDNWQWTAEPVIGRQPRILP